MFTKDDFIAAMVKIEHAVDAHDGLRRRSFGPAHSTPAHVIADRDGFVVVIDVLPGNKRKRLHSTICTRTPCESPIIAADQLIADLDFWAKAIA